MDAWIHDYTKHGGTISERDVDPEGNRIHIWGKLVRDRLNEFGIKGEDNAKKQIDSRRVRNSSDDGDDDLDITKFPASKNST